MKKYVLLSFVVLLLFGCRMNQQERAERLVEMYLEETASDPESINVLDVWVGDPKKEMDSGGNWVIRHYGIATYRGKNAYGATVEEQVTVCFNEEVTQIVCWDCFGK